MHILQYEAKLSNDWDYFIKSSKNGTFMLNRNYMDYHSDRFTDNSLMFYDDDKLAAIIPASLHGNELISHGGLTYGGIITDKKMTVQKMLAVFSSLKKYLKENNISKLIYKRVPSIYYTYPSDEDLYALFINDAKLIRRDISTTIALHNKIAFSKGKKWGVSKAKQANVEVKKFQDFGLFFRYENLILKQKYKTSATHSVQEMSFLASLFPNNIEMFGGFINNEFLSGVIVYKTETVIHAQYIVTTEKGRELLAFELIMDYMVNSNYCSNAKYFDFGISTEQNGRYLNEGLIRQKEMFGGRATTYDFYELSA